MNKAFTLLGLATLPLLAQAQVVTPQPQAVVEYLNGNNISNVPFLTDGYLFANPFVAQPNTRELWQVPRNSGLSTLYGSSLWIGGKDNNNILYVAGDTYRQQYLNPTLEQSYWFGPVASNYDSAYNARYNKLWKITKTEVDAHQLNFNQSGYTTPASINSWPAHGNTSNGEATNLAPYFDFNNNGVYDPANGDYPLIRGTEAIYFITNESRHSKYPNSPAMGLEIHGMAYVFDIPSDSMLYNTLFLNYRIVNRSSRNYQDVHVGMWTDFDIGNYNNDYVGSDVQNNAFYGYNGTDHDSLDTGNPPNPFLIFGYGAKPPAQGVVFLGGAQMTSFMSYESNFSVRGNPETAQHFYNYLRGYWKDNSPITFGGLGKNDVTNIPYKYFFPNDSDPTGIGFYPNSLQTSPFTWHEDNLSNQGGSNNPSDRRGIGAIGPLTLAAGQEICLDIAFPFVQGNDRLHSVDLLKRRFQQIHSFYNNTFGNSCNLQVTSLNKQLEKQPLVQVYPNPAQEMVTLSFSNDFTTDVPVTLFDVSGKKLQSELMQPRNGKQQQLHLRNLPAGLYFLHIQHKELPQTIKLVITK